MGLIKTPGEITCMREGGAILADALFQLIDAAKPGITTNDLDLLFAEYIAQRGATASFLDYHGYPKSICTSVNDEVVHAIPSDRVLEEGDIIGIDCGVRYNGYCTDMARTIGIGRITAEAQQLIDVTRASLEKAIPVLRAGNQIGDIGHTIQSYVQPYGYGIVRVLVGHGVGESVHEDPQVPNYGRAHTGLQLKVGMVLAVEPMLNLGGAEVEFDEQDGWTVRTADGSLSAHSEDTIAITADGPVVLTTPSKHIR
jgi:methionyl aminopeptidase